MEFSKRTLGEAHFYNLDGDEVQKKIVEIKRDADAAEKAGYEHFMMKEIHEQTKVVLDTQNSVIKDGRIDLSAVGLTDDEIKAIEQSYIVACGPTWYVSMETQYEIENLVEIPVRVELSSEFRYRKMPLNKNALVLMISQSGYSSFEVFRVLHECGKRT